MSQLERCLNGDHIIIGGDFNLDFSKQYSSNHRLLTSFIENESLKCGISCLKSKNCFSYESKANGSKSLIDHFLVSENLFNCLNNYYVEYNGSNLSDHNPICMSLSKPVSMAPTIYQDETITCNWIKANISDINNYQCRLDAELNNIQMPWEAIHCNDFFCKNHCEDIVFLHDSIIDALTITGSETIPHDRLRSKPKSIPGWNEHVQEKKEKSIFWNSIWRDNGCPRNGVVADTYRRARAAYHYAIRAVKKNEDTIKGTKIAKAFCDNRHRDFWTEIKKIHSDKSKCQSSMDGKTGVKNVCDVFVKKYSELYNSVSFKKNEFNTIMKKNNLLIESCCCKDKCYSNHNIDYNDVAHSIKSLKNGKSDGQSGLFSDHFINGTAKLNIYLTFLFNVMLVHGFVPDSMLLGTLIPIPKNKRKSLNDSNNYRGITLSSIIGKMFDNILLRNNFEIFRTNDLQFGFKPDHSTTQCTFAVQEVCNYYVKQNSEVYCVLLDASQAFDRVEYVKLFSLLFNKNICPLVARLLAFMYVNQKLRIRYSSYLSECFNLSNGVKQGGVLSPFLFSLYIDELFYRLKQSGIGCYIGNVFAGAFGYADDVTLLAPTQTSINTMLEIVRKFGLEFNVKFNPCKTKLLIFNKLHDIVHNVIFDNTSLINDANATHLGNFIGKDPQKLCIDKAVNNFICNFNFIMSSFSMCSYEIKYSLMKSFCMSLYGSVLWDFDNDYVNRFFVTWRKSVRKLLNLPYQTHSRYLNHLVNDLNIETQLHKRFLNFLDKLNNSSNNILSLCGKLALSGSNSSTCRNVNLCRKLYNLDFNSPIFFKNNVHKLNEIGRFCDDKDFSKIDHIKDILVLIQDNFFNFDQGQDLLKHFAT